MAAPDELEQRLAGLPRGRIKDSFQILAEWLKENREALQNQIAGLAIRFEEVNREDKRRLEEIHAETRETNGKVADAHIKIADLENARRLDSALADGHEEWESGHEARQREASETRDREREKRHDRLMSVGLVLLGMFGGTLVPAFLKYLGVS